MIFTVFLKDGSMYSYDSEKFGWLFGDKNFCVKSEENDCILLVCPLEEVVKVIVEGDEL